MTVLGSGVKPGSDGPRCTRTWSAARRRRCSSGSAAEATRVTDRASNRARDASTSAADWSSSAASCRVTARPGASSATKSPGAKASSVASNPRARSTRRWKFQYQSGRNSSRQALPPRWTQGASSLRAHGQRAGSGLQDLERRVGAAAQGVKPAQDHERPYADAKRLTGEIRVSNEGAVTPTLHPDRLLERPVVSFVAPDGPLAVQREGDEVGVAPRM